MSWKSVWCFTFWILISRVCTFQHNYFASQLSLKKRSQASQVFETVKVQTPPHPLHQYDTIIGDNILGNIHDYIKETKFSKVFIISNEITNSLFVNQVRQSFEQIPVTICEYILPDGESYKSMDYVLRIIESAVDNLLDRKALFVAVGGGVVGDIAGFAASIYQRGVNFVQVPTTLMAMVDSSVGGKTGVNLSRGKNLVGSFYHPVAVIADVSTLNFLRDREFFSGLAETIKYGAIQNIELLEWLESNWESIVARDVHALESMIARCCRIKADIVLQDEKEHGKRAILNFGHTFGHAIETGLGYGTCLHGEAVALGMVMAAKLSYAMGLIPVEDVVRLENILKRFSLPIRLSTLVNSNRMKSKSMSKDDFLQLFAVDKKSSFGKTNFVLLKDHIGNSIVTNDVDYNVLSSVIEDFLLE